MSTSSQSRCNYAKHYCESSEVDPNYHRCNYAKHYCKSSEVGPNDRTLHHVTPSVAVKPIAQQVNAGRLYFSGTSLILSYLERCVCVRRQTLTGGSASSIQRAIRKPCWDRPQRDHGLIPYPIGFSKRIITSVTHTLPCEWVFMCRDLVIEMASAN